MSDVEPGRDSESPLAGKIAFLADLIDPYTGDNELNDKIAHALAPYVDLKEDTALAVAVEDL